jgi:hypothetical protein
MHRPQLIENTNPNYALYIVVKLRQIEYLDGFLGYSEVFPPQNGGIADFITGGFAMVR